MNNQRNRAIAGLFAAALVASACTAVDNESAQTTVTVTETTVATVPPTVAASTTTIAPAPPTTEAGPSPEEVASVDAALAVKNAFFVASNAGDQATVMGLFTADAEFVDGDRKFFEELLAWNTAQGTRYTPLDCTASADTEPSGVVVSCRFVTHDAPSIASGGPPVPQTVNMLITPEGIATYEDRFGQPDFNTVGDPFRRWMKQENPQDVDLVAFGTWDSIEEATTNGTIVARYAAEWGRYLEANGCAYDENC